MGWIFLWAFVDKLLGLGFATAPEKSWLAGGSPTTGFLKFAAKGPFVEIFHAMAGNPIVDWLFMLGLLLIGLALLLGIGVRIAGYSGALYALLTRFTNLEFFHWTYSGKAVVMAIIGGVGSLIGPFVGTAFYLLSNEYLSQFFQQFVIVVGVILLIVIRYAPEGLWGLFVGWVRGHRSP